MDIQKYKQAFLEDVRKQISALHTALPLMQTDAQALADARRALHSLKSTAAAMDFTELSALALKHEELLKIHIEASTLPTEADIAVMTDVLREIEEHLHTMEKG